MRWAGPLCARGPGVRPGSAPEARRAVAWAEGLLQDKGTETSQARHPKPHATKYASPKFFFFLGVLTLLG